MAGSGQGQRSMSVASFARAMQLNQSQESPVSSIDGGSVLPAEEESVPPVPRVPSMYNPARPNGQQAPSQSPRTQPTSATDRPLMRDGPVRQPVQIPSPPIRSMKGSIAEPEHSVKRKKSSFTKQRLVPEHDDFEAMSMPLNRSWPFSPTRPDFPSDVFEPRHLKGRTKNEPPRQASPAMPEKPRMNDRYHRDVHDEYPPVSQPNTNPPRRPLPKRIESESKCKRRNSFFKGLKEKTTRGFSTHRNCSNTGRSDIEISLPIHGSFRDVDPATHGQANFLHAKVKDIPIHEAQRKLAGQGAHLESLPAKRQPAKPRTVKVVGHPDRGTVFGDFTDSHIFDSGSDEDVGVPPRTSDTQPSPNDSLLDVQAAKPIRSTTTLGLPQRDPSHAPYGKRPITSGTAARASHLHETEQSLGSRRPAPPRTGLVINPSSTVDWNGIHQGSYRPGPQVRNGPNIHAGVWTPRFDGESVRSGDLFAGVTDEEVSHARRQAFLDSARSHERTYQPRQMFDEEDAAVDQLFDWIDYVVANNDSIPEHGKHWANEELHRMDELLDRERRASDGSIVIDTFPHDAHTSWRATERTDDLTIHSDRRRFTREVHHNGGYQDAAGISMEQLVRRMQG